MEYVLLNIDFTGNDDANVMGFIARPVESKKEWLRQIKSAIKEQFKENNGFLELYNSDNCSTPFESVEEVLSIFSMKTITQQQFEVLSTLFEGSDQEVSYGYSENFLDYSAPLPKDKVKIRHGEIMEQIKLYCKDDTSDKVYNITMEKLEHGYVVNYANGKRDGKLTEGTKTEHPMAYDYAKEIFDALVKSKNKYTTDPSGVIKKLKLK